MTKCKKTRTQKKKGENEENTEKGGKKMKIIILKIEKNIERRKS